MMRPWLIITGDFTLTGGMDRANFALAHRLATRGFPVHLVAHRVDDVLANHQNVTIHRVPRPGGMHFPASFLLTHRARQVARRNPHATIVANGGNFPGAHLNWVHYLHAAWNSPSLGGPIRRTKSCIERYVERSRESQALTQSDIVICNSHRTAEQVISRIGVPADRVHTVYYGADVNRFQMIRPEERRRMRSSLGIAEDQICGAFVGALGDRRKNFDTLFAAWSRLADDPVWHNAVLLVIGQGAQLRTWRTRAEASGQSTRFQFLGFRSDVPDVLAACDLLVHPARYEAFGLSPFEALCRGVPVLVSACSGVSELIPDRLTDWTLQSPDDTDELVAKLQQWQRERESRSETARWLSHHVRLRSWDEMADDIIQLGMDHADSHLECCSADVASPGLLRTPVAYEARTIGPMNRRPA